MAKKEESSLAWLYIGLGAVAAVGAGYLAWRYLLDESTKKSIRNTTTTLLRQGQEYAEDASVTAIESGRVAAREAIARVRNS